MATGPGAKSPSVGPYWLRVAGRAWRDTFTAHGWGAGTISGALVSGVGVAATYVLGDGEIAGVLEALTGIAIGCGSSVLVAAVVLGVKFAFAPARMDLEARQELALALGAVRKATDSSRHSNIAFMLGVMLSRARFLQDGDEFKEWEGTTEMLIGRAFGHGESSLFRSAYGMTFDGDGSDVSKLRNMIDARCRRLQDLIIRISTLPIEPDFDGDEWKVGIDLDPGVDEIDAHFTIVHSSSVPDEISSVHSLPLRSTP